MAYGPLGPTGIAILGARPALVPADLKLPLRELRTFRPLFVHAYQLKLDPEKLVLLLKCAQQVADRLPGLADKFIRQVATEQSIALP